MQIKAVVFDIGQTLVYYPFPLNWSAMYRPVFESIAKAHGLTVSEEEYAHIGGTLAKYNTRINPREREVSSDTIFREILEGTNIPSDLLQEIKRDFYGFFRRDTMIYEEAEATLAALRERGLLICTLSDVAYGMDNEYAFADAGALIEYIDIPYTSNDTGYRKPCGRGLELIAEKAGISPAEMIFVGDEKKDMECAANAGAVSVLIDRTDGEKSFGQDYTIKSLAELLTLTENI